MRRRPVRRGLALIDVVVGGLMLGVGLSVVLSVASRAIARQTEGEKRMVASWLADELLNMVLAEGPEDYPAVHDTEDAFGAPFEEYSYTVDIESLGRSEPYRVTATVSWPGRAVNFVEVQTIIAAHQGEPIQLREPYEPVDRDARYFGEDDEGGGLGGATAP